MTTVLCVPQWQGSASDAAPRLVDGAHRAAASVPADRIVTVPVVGESGPTVGGVRAFDALVANVRLVGEALQTIEDRVITVGGDCSVDIAPIAAARHRYGVALTVLWIDAHPDVYSPKTLPSGAFHGMVVRALLGDADIPGGLVPESTLTPDRVVIVGERAGADSEHAYLAVNGLRRYGVAEIERAFDGLGNGPVYVHVDLDVLEPTVFGSTCYPEPDGLDPTRLAELIAGIDTVVGAAITEHAPAGDPDEGEADIIRTLARAMTGKWVW
jgi:arginase